MRRGARVAALAAATFLGAASAAAAPARWHFAFGKAWEVSILFEREERKGDTTRLLLKAEAGRFTFLSTQNPSGRDSTESIRRLPGGETFTRRLVLSSFEDIPACAAVRAPDACVVLTGANGALGTPISAFSGADAALLRGRAAALVSPGMRDALFSVAPLLPAFAEFGSYTKDFLALVWPDRFAAPQKLVRGERGPGCAFDAAFGFPCSPEEETREAKRFPDARR
jgi:hypothetical protein